MSAAAAKLFSASFLRGLSVSGFCKTVRRSGAKISEAKILSIVQAYRTAIELEYQHQQCLIDESYQTNQTTAIAVDTSFSQIRNARFGQTAALEHKSGEIVKMVVLDKKELKCNSNSLEPLGVAKIVDQSFSNKNYFQ